MVVVGFNATPSGDVLLAPMEAERLALFWNALGWVLLGPPEVIILLVLIWCWFLVSLFRRWIGGLVD
jgi:hypothetical protein